jgi:phospholipase C
MDTRRNFLKKAILLSGTAGMSASLPGAVQRAMVIDPDPGSTYIDAEHVVILMQENRSFDHCFGSLRGVRGFNDPRAMRQPGGNLVWMQTNEKGETYVPFHFDINQTKATWMGSTPHSRSDQVDAWNYGRYDQWLPAKRVRDKRYADMPLTLGYYNRRDIPFHYALADAFTICDQHFCSVMSSTDPNRIFFWSGTILDQQKEHASARIRNDFPGLGTLKWNSFPEKLQDNHISWKVYQNDIQAGGGFKGAERAWLGNFGCNPLEWFSSYQVKFFGRYIQTLQKQVATLTKEIEALQKALRDSSPEELAKKQKALEKKKEVLENAKKELVEWSSENYDKLSQRDKELHERAFTNNKKDPYYHDLTTLTYREDGGDRSLQIPKGDVLYQFREDVRTGELPTVSWLVAPWNLIDHPSAPWYGSLYMSEILNILTDNPDVWKKTIFILTFDENDGYFDHVPPFVAPNPHHPHTGRCSAGIDSKLDYVHKEDEIKAGVSERTAREAPIGLGYRVPMIVASPWSRGGRVCSQVFDHTSTIQFLEKFLNEKFGKAIFDTNVSAWRRTVSGNLTSIFQKYQEGEDHKLPFLKKDSFYEKIYNAKFKDIPGGFTALSEKEIAHINQDPTASPLMPKQERGIRPSLPLPYELYVDGNLDKGAMNIIFQCGDKLFKQDTAGAAFNLYLHKGFSLKGNADFRRSGSRSYTVARGGNLTENFPIGSSEDGIYHLSINGPNGFYREFKGSKKDPMINIFCGHETQSGLTKKFSGNVMLSFDPLAIYESYTIEITDNAYKNKKIIKTIPANKKGATHHIVLNLEKSYGWYDFTFRIKGFDAFSKRYAGHVETGRLSFTDPLMGGVV